MRTERRPKRDVCLKEETVHLCPILTGLIICVLFSQGTTLFVSYSHRAQLLCPILTGMNKCVLFVSKRWNLHGRLGEAQIDAVGLRRRIRLRGLLVRELRELRRIQVAGAMPADVVGTMLRSALVLDLY